MDHFLLQDDETSQMLAFPSAKIKLDELFNDWIRTQGASAICSMVLDSLSAESSSDSTNNSTGNGRNMLISSGLAGNGHGPPRSLAGLKSPKKRTQSEMLSKGPVNNDSNNNTNNTVNKTNSSNNNNNNNSSNDTINNSRSSSTDNNNDSSSSASSSNNSANTDNSNDSNSSSVSASSSSGDKSSREGQSSTTGNDKNSMDTDMMMDAAPQSPSSSSDRNSRLEKNSNYNQDEKSASRRRANFDKIPAFYFPKQRASRSNTICEEDKLTNKLLDIETYFKPYNGEIPVEKFVHVTKKLIGIPSFFNLPLCKRINELFDPDDVPPPRIVGRNSNQVIRSNVKLKSFLKYWQLEVEPYDRTERLFRIIKQQDADYIVKEDFMPFLLELLHFHPGLDFLEEHEEFQKKYSLTVITRIFYKVNTSRSGKLNLREVRSSNLYQACMHADEETDINRVVDYFSYEHFYVLYCKFFELDTDRDSKLTRNDLMKYYEHSLSDAIVDRIFQVGIRPFTDGECGNFEKTGMSYPDFIFFMLSEEDKSNESSLRYWFNCCDLDGDSKLSSEEMKFFYRHQIHRVTSLGQESINFNDVLCQMIDMIAPDDQFGITLKDMIRPTKMLFSGVLFDILFNLHKFMRFEMRDPFQEKIKRDDGYASDWDRYAHMEYNRLAMEEETGYNSMMDDEDNPLDMEYLDIAETSDTMSSFGS